jgi:hypothetical protein
VQSTTTFLFDREAMFSPGVTRSQTKATRQMIMMLQTGGGLSFNELPVDAQCCGLTFLARYELARCYDRSSTE